jgi:AraC family transcriptional activator of pobA
LERPSVLALDRASVKATDLAVLGDMLLREFGRSAAGRHVALRGLIAALLANVMRLMRISDTGAADFAAPMQELVARFRRLVELRHREHMGLGVYADRLGVSQARLRRACLSVAGQAPAQLVHLRLLVEAERQLRYTSMSIAQIAYHLGFQDPAYFSRFFTTRMRQSPRAFRARL